MMRISLLFGVAFIALLLAAQSSPSNKLQDTAVNVPEYTADGRLKFPEHYREWVYLSTGMDMNYRPDAGMGHSMFDNVFVNPEAWKAFQTTGTWPDKTMLVLEVRGAGSKSAINKAGHYQTTELMGREVHVKDEARFAETSKWAFFGFDDDKPAPMIMKEMTCYSCHQDHAAVDTTFVQFYPTLIELAKKKGTLSAAYLKEEPEAAK